MADLLGPPGDHPRERRSGRQSPAGLGRLSIGSTTLGQAMVAVASGSEMTMPRLYGAISHLTADEAARVGR